MMMAQDGPNPATAMLRGQIRAMVGLLDSYDAVIGELRTTHAELVRILMVRAELRAQSREDRGSDHERDAP